MFQFFHLFLEKMLRVLCNEESTNGPRLDEFHTQVIVRDVTFFLRYIPVRDLDICERAHTKMMLRNEVDSMAVKLEN
jgi:hypothetical protein